MDAQRNGLKDFVMVFWEAINSAVLRTRPQMSLLLHAGVCFWSYINYTVMA